MSFWFSKTSWYRIEEHKAHHIIYTQNHYEDLTLADLLQNLDIDLNIYMEALQISQKGHRIILQ